jgi:hypothetical protein
MTHLAAHERHAHPTAHQITRPLHSNDSYQ